MRGYDPFMEENLIGHHNPELYSPKDPLDTKDQHIVALAMKNGFLVGRNSVLENANSEQQRRIHDLEKDLSTTQKSLTEYRDRYDEERDERYTAQREVERLKQYEKYAPKLKKGTTK